MSLTNWVLVYLADVAFWSWIFYLGGAEKLGYSIISGIFTFVITLKWREMSADGIKLFGWVILITHTFFFLIGIFVPEFRAFF